MEFSANYFARYSNHPEIFEISPDPVTDAIVVIPSYNDPEVFKTLDSLEEAMDGSFCIEVMVIVNSSENTPKHIVNTNRDIFRELQQLSINNKYSFTLLCTNLENIPHKIAGVGNARKTGMDEAVRRYQKINKPEGIIISLDADCLVSKDYFSMIINSFRNNKSYGAFVFQFRHDLNINTYPSDIIQACRLYEMYLRYFRLSLKLTGFPYCYHTIGSCFAVRAISYIKAGGMSRRQGGEDFYFIQKLAPMTQIGSIDKAIVFPSPRISDRVPFGTGPSVRNIINDKIYKVYNFDLFFLLKDFFEYFNELYSGNEINLSRIPPEIIYYTGKDNLFSIIHECKNNSGNPRSFFKRMFSKFDVFFIIKFLNSFNTGNRYCPTDINNAAVSVLKYYNLKTMQCNTGEIDTLLLNLDIDTGIQPQ